MKVTFTKHHACDLMGNPTLVLNLFLSTFWLEECTQDSKRLVLPFLVSLSSFTHCGPKIESDFTL